MKILEVTAFSSGICGLWSRVKKESELLAEKGHEVHVFSSNIKRGSGKKEFDRSFEIQGKVKINRFKTFGNFGENTYFWNYEKKALELKPEIIICHAYRQYYSTKALSVAKKLKIPCVLVTHAPFLEKKLRNKKLNLAVSIYDNLIGKKILNKYDSVFTITKWEIPSLLDLGLKKEKIFYSPNGIPKEFFIKKISKKSNKNKILFLGRIAPIKDLETLLKAFSLSLKQNKNLILTLAGPAEEPYKKILEKLIKDLDLEKKVQFHEAIYDLDKKIDLIDKHEIFILPSKREAMPQSLIEAMSREKIVISSKNQGSKEIIKNNKNGFLFEIGNYKELSEKVLQVSKNSFSIKKIKEQAKKNVEKFSWDNLIQKIEDKIKQIVSENQHNNTYKFSL